MIKLGYKKGGHDLGANLFDTFGLACLWPSLQPLDGTVARCGTFSRSNKRETNKNSKREDFLEGGRVFVLSCFFSRSALHWHLTPLVIHWKKDARM